MPAPLDVVPTPGHGDGAILPLSARGRGRLRPWKTPTAMLWVFPHRGEGAQAFRLYEDDGETTAHRRGHFCEIEIVMETTPDEVRLFAHREGVFEPGFQRIQRRAAASERRQSD